MRWLPVVSYRFDAALEWISPDARPAGGARVAVHHGTREAPARLAELGGPLRAAAARAAAGRARRRPARDPLAGAAGHARRRRGARPRAARATGPRATCWPASPGCERGEPEPEPAPEPAPAAARPEPAPLSPAALAIEEELRAAGAEPPLDADLDAAEELAALREAGRAVRLGPAMHVHAEALDEVRARLVALLEAEGEVTLGRLRDELGTSRKYAQALLEHFDAERLTLRRGDVRVLRRRRA